MSRVHFAREKGAATTETVLGILVLIPVLLYGIHFAELGVVQMKVLEAGAAPIWDSTAFPTHVVGMPASHQPMRDKAIQVSNAVAEIRYKVNFDGRVSNLLANRTGRFTGVPFIQWGQFLTGAGMLVTKCAPTDPAMYPLVPSPGPRLGFDIDYFTTSFTTDTDGINCFSEAAAFNILPNAFMEASQGGLFQASMKEGVANKFAVRICSMGRPGGLNGDCVGTSAMLLDDWGLGNQGKDLLGGAENDNCTVTLYGAPCENIPYFMAGQRLYQIATAGQSLLNSLGSLFGFGAPHRQLVNSVVGGVGGVLGFFSSIGLSTDTMFYMSFTGSDPLMFNVPVIAGDGDTIIWQTTPFQWPPTYAASWGIRKKCYLGLPGC